MNAWQDRNTNEAQDTVTVFYKSGGPSKLNQLLQPLTSLEKKKHTLTFRGKEQKHHFMQQMPYIWSVAITEGTN